MSDDNNTKPHPLDQTFDIDPGMHLKQEDDDSGIEIPDDPTLDTIIDMSLKAYKEQMDDMSFVDPKNRARFYEIAERFLNQAKDAIHKKEQIKTQREKLKGAKKPNGKTSSGDEGNGEEVSRKELYEHIKRVK